LSLIGNVPIIMPRICIGGSKKNGTLQGFVRHDGA